MVLKRPSTTPFEPEIVGVDTSNNQIGITLGNGLSLINTTIQIDSKQVFLATHPIDSYYITEENENPIDKYGGGWLQIKDCFLWATGDTTSITYTENGTSVTKSLTLGSTGGEATHTLTTDEMPSHSHDIGPICTGGLAGISYTQVSNGANASWDGTAAGLKKYVNNTGGNVAHNNMPPYRAVKVWKRIS